LISVVLKVVFAVAFLLSLTFAYLYIFGHLLISRVAIQIGFVC